MDNFRQHLTDVQCELVYSQRLLTTVLTGGIDVSLPALKPRNDIFNIHRDINLPKRYLTFFNLPRPATAATATVYCYCVTPQISETAHRTLGLACGFGTVGLQ